MGFASAMARKRAMGSALIKAQEAMPPELLRREENLFLS
jgi:hypothetical protein